ncbi:hypothetical protein V8B55DRAFT_1582916 [Mucor lusitanicus]|uniref:Uncharacterized protein n=2 Tax=Mucor circinelloides f. lusitanicus TaxID=29924 RepID=A0A168KIN0_MUCCL|nr:hypothetical protein FB192DRAFT_1352458 [Mucor lusitanicus]OAD02434.1 hypothetical protein MUCCIDRAFT_164360 [Mucor lusitanicus CBS 277.49]
MSSFVVAKNALTTNQILDNLDNCKNTTVGANKYQLYCLSTADVSGSCVLLPSRYMPNGEINCFTVTSQTFLEKLYEDTGNSCAINCFYPLSQVQVPTIPAYTYSYSYSYSYSLDVPAYTTPAANNPTATPFPGAGTQTVSGLDAAGTNTAVTTAPNATHSVTPLPANGSTTMGPNFLLTSMAIFAIVLMFARKAM